MIFKIENYKDDIRFNINHIIVNVFECDKNQIQMYDKNNILYCEKPLCEETCPIDKSAYCAPSQNNKYNDPRLNHCVCLYGWKGTYCNEKKFINYRFILFTNYYI